MTNTNAGDGAAEEPTTPPETPKPRPARWKLTIVIGTIVAIQIANYIASATLFTLVNDHPLWLVLMQPTTKNLLLVSEHIFIVTFFVVTILRRQLPHPFWFLIGRWYGQSGLKWVSKRFPEFGNILDQIEDAFPKWGPLICAIYPHPIVCAMAGASKMRFVPFLVYTFLGIIAYVSVARLFGDWLTPITRPVLNFSHDYVIPLTVLTVAITAFTIWKAIRADRLESVSSMERELDNESTRDEN